MDNFEHSVLKFLSEVEKDFSNNQRKQLARLAPRLGKDVAVALIGMQGRTSRAEIDFIAEIISPFKPFKIYSFRKQPRKIVLEGVGPEGHVIRIHPQYAILQPEILSTSKNQQYWWVDLAVELHKQFDGDLIRLAAVGFEYDGHDAHFIESKIKKSYVRDVGIMYQEGFQPMHIAPEHWKKHPNLYIDTMVRYFWKRIREVQVLDLQALKKMYLEQVDTPEFVVIGSGGVKRAIPLVRELDELYNK